MSPVVGTNPSLQSLIVFFRFHSLGSSSRFLEIHALDDQTKGDPCSRPTAPTHRARQNPSLLGISCRSRCRNPEGLDRITQRETHRYSCYVPTDREAHAFTVREANTYRHFARVVNECVSPSNKTGNQHKENVDNGELFCVFWH